MTLLRHLTECMRKRRIDGRRPSFQCIVAYSSSKLKVDDNQTAKQSKSKGKTNGEDTNGRTSSIDRKDSDLEDSNESRSRHKGCIIM